MVDIQQASRSSEKEPQKIEKIEDIFDLRESSQPKSPEIRPASEAPPSPEREHPPEAAPEQRATEDETARRQYTPPPPSNQSAASVKTKSERLRQIENILAENLDELYLGMTPQQQMEFRQTGEKTATKVNELLQETKIKVKEILNLIKEWLKILPGVNKFFLEQEAKIKTDRIINLHEQKSKEH